MNWKQNLLLLCLGNPQQIIYSPCLSFCPSSVLLLRLHSLLCALRNKTEDKQKSFAKWMGYLLRVALLILAPTQAIQSAEIGQTLSSCVLTQLSKNDQNILKNLENKVLYLDFWASWCPPCAKSFSFLNELHNQFLQDGLIIIAINLDEVPEDAKEFLTRYPADFTVDLDFNRQCAKELGVLAMPSSYLIDQKGIIRHIHLGFRSSQATELRNQVEQLLSDSAPTPSL